MPPRNPPSSDILRPVLRPFIKIRKKPGFIIWINGIHPPYCSYIICKRVAVTVFLLPLAPSHLSFGSTSIRTGSCAEDGPVSSLVHKLPLGRSGRSRPLWRYLRQKGRDHLGHDRKVGSLEQRKCSAPALRRLTHNPDVWIARSTPSALQLWSIASM